MLTCILFTSRGYPIETANSLVFTDWPQSLPLKVTHSIPDFLIKKKEG